MGELLRKILNIIAWIALIVGVIMVLWKIFGNSPTDLALISPFVVFGLAKIWGIDNSLREFKYNVKLSFKKVDNDMNDLKKKANNLENNIGDKKNG